MLFFFQEKSQRPPTYLLNREGFQDQSIMLRKKNPNASNFVRHATFMKLFVRQCIFNYLARSDISSFSPSPCLHGLQQIYLTRRVFRTLLPTSSRDFQKLLFDSTHCIMVLITLSFMIWKWYLFIHIFFFQS